jgi:hypothetical protein
VKIIWYIILVCLGSWGLVSFLFVPEATMEIFLGMLTPLLVGISTLFMVQRIHGEKSSRLTAFMTKAFLGKMVLYGVYVILVVGLYSFQPIPFIISFTVYFSGLHIVEALYFRTLFAV